MGELDSPKKKRVHGDRERGIGRGIGEERLRRETERGGVGERQIDRHTNRKTHRERGERDRDRYRDRGRTGGKRERGREQDGRREREGGDRDRQRGRHTDTQRKRWHVDGSVSCGGSIYGLPERDDR